MSGVSKFSVWSSSALRYGVVEPPGEHVDGAVVVDGAEDVVEVDGAVEEVPGDVALEGAQEGVDAHHVLAGRPRDVGEVLVAAEVEAAEVELAVALGVGLRTRLDLGHRWSLMWCRPCRLRGRAGQLRQISAQRSMVSSPWMVCSRITPGAGGDEAVRGVGREQRHVTPAQHDPTHRPARPARRRRRPNPFLSAGASGVVELDQLDRDLAVQAQRELVVGARPPLARPLGADHLEHVLHVLADGDLLPRLGVRGDLEDVREGVVLGLVVDDVDAALV